MFHSFTFLQSSQGRFTFLPHQTFMCGSQKLWNSTFLIDGNALASSACPMSSAKRHHYSPCTKEGLPLMLPVAFIAPQPQNDTRTASRTGSRKELPLYPSKVQNLSHGGCGFTRSLCFSNCFTCSQGKEVRLVWADHMGDRQICPSNSVAAELETTCQVSCLADSLNCRQNLQPTSISSNLLQWFDPSLGCNQENYLAHWLFCTWHQENN